MNCNILDEKKGWQHQSVESAFHDILTFDHILKEYISTSIH